MSKFILAFCSLVWYNYIKCLDSPVSCRVIMCLKGGEIVVYKIGDFSNLVNISIRTLRYYDEIGLLKPEFVDKFTNYRYYTEDNVVEAQFITLLKEVGFTLQEIIDYKIFLNNYDSDDEGTNQFLLKKQQQISEEMEKLQEQYDKITILRKKFKGKVLTLMKEENNAK